MAIKSVPSGTFPPDIQTVISILAAARVRRLAAEAEGGSEHERADESGSPRVPQFKPRRPSDDR